MKILTLVLTLIVSTASFAGPGHGHSHGGHSQKVRPISKEKTKEIGMKHIERLVKAGKLDSSWKKANYEKTEGKMFGHRKEWLVTFKNDEGIKGKKLFIFVKVSGEFVAANFTGK